MCSESKEDWIYVVEGDVSLGSEVACVVHADLNVAGGVGGRRVDCLDAETLIVELVDL